MTAEAESAEFEALRPERVLVLRVGEPGQALGLEVAAAVQELERVVVLVALQAPVQELALGRGGVEGEV